MHGQDCGKAEVRSQDAQSTHLHPLLLCPHHPPLHLSRGFLYTIHLHIGVRCFLVLSVIAVQIGQLGQEFEDTLSVIVQVSDLTAKEIQAFQTIQFF